jgi:polysaccharide transporter, PST family
MNLLKKLSNILRVPFSFVSDELFIGNTDKDRAISNLFWLTIDRVVRLGLGFVMSILLARYLTIADFGILNYLMSFFVIFAALGSFGVNGIAVKLMSYIEKSNKIITSALLIYVAGVTFSAVIMFTLINVMSPNDIEVKLLSLILSISLLLKPSDVIRFWFESQLMSKFTVFSDVSAFIFIFFAKIIMIALNAPLAYFLVACFMELLISSLMLYYYFLKKTNANYVWCYSKKVTKLIFSRSWPVAISVVSIVVYMKIDQVMIGQILNIESVGIYSAAVIISESVYFLPVIINQTLRPILFKERKKSYLKFVNRMQSLYKFMMIFAILYSILISLFSEDILRITYGEGFSAASDALIIHAWASVFVFLNNTTWTWHISENQQKIASIKLFCGLILNIVLNYLLIPLYGITGAAIATILSRAFSSYVMNLFFSNTRQLFFMMSYALILKSKKW